MPFVSIALDQANLGKLSFLSLNKMINSKQVVSQKMSKVKISCFIMLHPGTLISPPQRRGPFKGGATRPRTLHLQIWDGEDLKTLTQTEKKIVFRAMRTLLKDPSASETALYMGVSKNRGTPKSSILIGFSIINHPFWGTRVPLFLETPIFGFCFS